MGGRVAGRGGVVGGGGGWGAGGGGLVRDFRISGVRTRILGTCPV